jgi:hypothetical protein
VYIAPELSFDAFQQGIFGFFGNASLEGNASFDKARLRLFAWSSLTYVRADGELPGNDVADPDDLFTNIRGGVWAAALRSLPNGFALGTEAVIEHDPQNNQRLRAATYVGGDWRLRPFLQTDEGNIGVNYIVGAERQQFFLETEQSKYLTHFMRHKLTVIGTWHFSRVDVSGSLDASSQLTNLDFTSLGVSASVSWRIIDDLWLTLDGGSNSRSALVQTPKDLSQIHPLAQFFGGGNFGSLNFQASISLRYTFGNSLLQRQDQRWRT